MRRLVKKREALKMDLTPLIDVVFLLLIFFIVASEFKKDNTILNLILPSSGSEKILEKQKDIMLEISSTQFAYNGKILEFEALEGDLKNIDKKTAINIKIDKDVKYKKIIKVLDLLDRLSLQNIVLITDKNKAL